MAKILFINPVIREEDIPRHIPYGIALLSAIAMENGHLVQVYDENAWRRGETVLREVLAADDWDFIGLGGITTAYGSIKRIVGLARDVCPSSVICLGGGVITSMPYDIMKWLPEVDVGAIGEGFVTFPEILARIDEGGRDFSDIHGTITRTANDALFLSPPRALIPDLDVLPYPAYDLFPLEEIYFPNSEMLFSEEGMLATRRLEINGSYGCSLVCKFCYHLGIAGDMRYEKDENSELAPAFDKPGFYSRTIRYHSPEYIVGLVKFLHDKYQVDFINFIDENLMTMDQYSGRTWLSGICDLWHKNGLVPITNEDGSWTGIHWSGTSHATLCNKEILHLMSKAGCVHLIYGYESFDDAVMKTIGKGATPKTNIRSFFWTFEAGIRPVPNQIMGFPADNFDSFRASMKAWEDLGIQVKPHFATPYPGSEWYTMYKAAILEQYDGSLEDFILDLGDATKITAVISHNFNAAELVGLREMMLNGSYRQIELYEKRWRNIHNIPDGEPSSLLPGYAPHLRPQTSDAKKLKPVRNAS
jgi:anaerobic magnesium-protoporphyrin IX monomethyl ester cyclase